MARGWARQTQCVCVCGWGGLQGPSHFKIVLHTISGPQPADLVGKRPTPQISKQYPWSYIEGKGVAKPREPQLHSSARWGASNALHCATAAPTELAIGIRHTSDWMEYGQDLQLCYGNWG